jgi:flavin reductase (DIM6/NTAB) family NADH-FMN oxidoreductase RutF
MRKILVTIAIVCATLHAQVIKVPTTVSAGEFALNPTQSVNPVIEWNKTLLVIVRTSGAQPATIHSTRSFAILHAAIYDSVNNIVGQFTPYLVRLPGCPRRAGLALSSISDHTGR